MNFSQVGQHPFAVKVIASVELQLVTNKAIIPIKGRSLKLVIRARDPQNICAFHFRLCTYSNREFSHRLHLKL